MHKLMDYVCDELASLESKVEKEGGLTRQDMQYLDTLAHTKKDMLSCERMEDEYSGDDGMSGRYSSRDSYAYADGPSDGTSGRDDRSFARGRMNAPRDSMGRYSGYSGYSRRGDPSEVLEEIKTLARELPPDARTKIDRVIRAHEGSRG